jgi:hypothetical protein
VKAGGGRIPYAVVVADVNADGHPDLAGVNPWDDLVSVSFNQCRRLHPRVRRGHVRDERERLRLPLRY